MNSSINKAVDWVVYATIGVVVAVVFALWLKLGWLTWPTTLIFGTATFVTKGCLTFRDWYCGLQEPDPMQGQAESYE
ncbi:MAG: hypothetical protein Q7K33_04525 [Candidatus Berkelbacteria bacterium]|nr:hypothetical protein [Candidatus Berkelbacteria bacterium]